jgi:hypothetical protein
MPNIPEKSPNHHNNLNFGVGPGYLFSNIFLATSTTAVPLISDASPEVVWTPRRELIARLPGVGRDIASTLRLYLRVRLAIWFGDTRACNLALDAMIIAQEGRIDGGV